MLPFMMTCYESQMHMCLKNYKAYLNYNYFMQAIGCSNASVFLAYFSPEVTKFTLNSAAHKMLKENCPAYSKENL